MGVGVTWEEEEDIPCGEVDFVAQYDASLEAGEAGASAGPESDDESDGEL